MCRWGCPLTNTTFMCKYCGTRYCKDCLRGEFYGLMIENNRCRICNQKKCQGDRVEFVDVKKTVSEKDGGKGKKGKAAKSGKGGAKKTKKSGKKKR
ncbi:uncharacterized protein [Amphiura filiformis]|uniref:uncharacterized protein n=1 Tax=Amphiura filiformis TaxID=82378 RepID=UPI003B21E656